MPEEMPVPAYGTTTLLLIAVAAVLVLLLLIIKLKLHAFPALVLVSLGTAIASGIELGDIVDVLSTGFGETLAEVALLVGFGAMLGRLLERSGGAHVLADVLLRRFGEKRAPLALGTAAFLFGLPIFFDAGLVIFLPIVFTVARRLGGSVLRYGIPVAGAFAVTHAFLPPHPGPVAAAELIGADIGLVLVFGLLIGIPTWFISAYLVGTRIGERNFVPVPEDSAFTDGGAAAGSGKDGGATAPATGSEEPKDRPGAAADGVPPPSFGTVLGLLLLPLVLIGANTLTDTLATAGTISEDNSFVEIAAVFGSTPVALLISLLVAMYVLGVRRGSTGAQVEKTVDGALGPIAGIVLITGAGGMFGGVLEASGTGSALASTLEDTGLPVIVAAFVIAVALRVALGSATVAITTAGGLVAPVVAASTGLSEVDLALIVVAIASGATVLSHVNDSGFWLVSRFFGMDERTTLKTWTVLETLIGCVGFALAFPLSLLL